jgi:hypothetical protein
MEPVNRIASEGNPMVSPYLLKPLRTEEQALRDIDASGAYCRPAACPRAELPARRLPDAAVRRKISGPAEVLVRAPSSRRRVAVFEPDDGHAPFTTPAGGRKAA